MVNERSSELPRAIGPRAIDPQAVDRSAAASRRNGVTVNGIQILRGLAAAIVVVRHIAKEFAHSGAGSAFEIGQFGVDIFFVISGFVIFVTAPRLSAGEFLKRRFIRVAPLYWLFLVVTIAGDLVRHGVDRDYVTSNTLLSFFFIPSHDHVGSMFPPLVVGWSLNFEAFFYVVTALVLACRPARDFLGGLTAAILALVVAGLAVRTFVDLSAAPVTIWLLPIILEFLAGAWVARWWQEGGQMPQPIGLLLLVGAIAWIAMAPAQTPYAIWRPLAWGVPATMIVLGTLAFESRLGAASLRPLHLLGDASYSLYLVHPVVIGLVLAVAHQALADVPFLVSLVVIAAGSVVAGIGVHFALERPLLRLTRHITSRATATGTPTAEASPVPSAGSLLRDRQFEDRS